MRAVDEAQRRDERASLREDHGLWLALCAVCGELATRRLSSCAACALLWRLVRWPSRVKFTRPHARYSSTGRAHIREFYVKQLTVSISPRPPRQLLFCCLASFFCVRLATCVKFTSYGTVLGSLSYYPTEYSRRARGPSIMSVIMCTMQFVNFTPRLFVNFTLRSKSPSETARVYE